MTMTDPIADMLTRIRNSYAILKDYVDMPLSSIKKDIAAAMKREGYISDFEIMPTPPQGVLRIYFKYGPDGEKIINKIQRVSKPGLRSYRGVKEIKPLLGGMGTVILSTSKGVLSDREAREANVGGEELCRIW